MGMLNAVFLTGKKQKGKIRTESLG